MATKVFEPVWVSKSVKEQIAEAAAAEKRKITVLAEQAIADYLTKHGHIPSDPHPEPAGK